MGAGLGDQFLARVGLTQQRQQVALRATGDEQTRLLAKNLRGKRFKRVDARVFAEDVVADLGVAHRLAHCPRRLGDGVTAEVETERGLGARRVSDGRECGGHSCHRVYDQAGYLLSAELL